MSPIVHPPVLQLQGYFICVSVPTQVGGTFRMEGMDTGIGWHCLQWEGFSSRKQSAIDSSSCAWALLLPQAPDCQITLLSQIFDAVPSHRFLSKSPVGLLIPQTSPTLSTHLLIS